MGLRLMRHEQALGKQRIIQPFPAMALYPKFFFFFFFFFFFNFFFIPVLDY